MAERKSIYFIPCTFKITEQSEMQYGFAVCCDPDTPVTFIYQNGMPYTGEDIWNYKLQHYSPWGQYETVG